MMAAMEIRLRSMVTTTWPVITAPREEIGIIKVVGARMLHDLHDELASRHVAFCIVGAHAQLRDLLLAEGLAEKTDSGEWLRTLDSVLRDGKAEERSDLHEDQPPRL